MVLQDSDTPECCGCYSNIISDIPKKINRDEITLNDFLELMGKSGGLITCMVISVPFLIPISLPGTGIAAGLAIFVISTSLIFDKDYLIPNRMMNYKMSKKNLIKVINATFRMLTHLEKYIKPRLLIMTRKSIMRKINGFFMIFSAMLFMTPLPIPLTDTLPALCVFFLAVGALECDGYLILAGYAAIIITTIYFGSVILLGYAGLSVGLSYLGLV
ncbi:exopolysaccharide biosynthesis protein [Methanobacterium sp.]|uniref:exopolysaccharide biosynthesis protein n=1 Tax=Methanobacterium sp. TaxID=2164 RepID=UPI003C760476